MANAAKLCNPTPFRVDLPWHRGINILIEPFGDTNLTMQQMDDYRPGKAGSADARSVLDYHGLFLLDTDRPYDNQALEALQRSHRAKKGQYEEVVKNLHMQRAKSGIAPNEAAFDENLKQLGYERLHNEVLQLEEAIKAFQKAVGTGPEKSTRPQYDPNRTVMVTEPPREFPSVAAMNFFLDQNPEIKAKHEALKVTSSTTPMPTAGEVNAKQESSVNPTREKPHASRT